MAERDDSTSDHFSQFPYNYTYVPPGDDDLGQLSYNDHEPVTFELGQPMTATAIANITSGSEYVHLDQSFHQVYYPRPGDQQQDSLHAQSQPLLDPSHSYGYELSAVQQPSIVANNHYGLPSDNASHPLEFEPLMDFSDPGYTPNDGSAPISSAEQPFLDIPVSSYDMAVSEELSIPFHEPCTSHHMLFMDPNNNTSFSMPQSQTNVSNWLPLHIEKPIDFKALQLRTKRTPIQKTPKSKKFQASEGISKRPRTQRRGPLSSEAREKADNMRMTGACWRCRRYRKPCNDAVVCDTCLTSGFRVWPSEIGCFRGTLFDLAKPLMPEDCESAFRSLTHFQKQPNWRRVQMTIPDHEYSLGSDSQQLVWRVLGTRMLGKDFVDLFKIVDSYQASRKTKDPFLTAACLHLSATTNFYHAFIATDAWYPTPDLTTTLQTYRASSRQLWRIFFKLSLSGRREHWFSLFLGAIIILLSVVIWTDAAFTMPASVRNSLWKDLQETIIEIRARLYMAALNLINILTQNSKPLTLPYWNKRTVELDDGTVKIERNEDGMRLLGGDEGQFDAICAFKAWLDIYGPDVAKHGKIWFSNKPFTMEDVRPIGVLSKIVFE